MQQKVMVEWDFKELWTSQNCNVHNSFLEIEIVCNRWITGYHVLKPKWVVMQDDWPMEMEYTVLVARKKEIMFETEILHLAGQNYLGKVAVEDVLALNAFAPEIDGNYSKVKLCKICCALNTKCIFPRIYPS